jgi:hypothetical protein
MRLLDTEVTLLVDGNLLPEYQIEVKGEHEVACYVPSETGKVSLCLDFLAPAN